jgi:signal transduction histidine kinase
VISRNPTGFWLGTQSGGLVNLNLKEKSITRFTIENGLPNNTINAILKEDNNILWLSTNHGISRFDIEAKLFASYSTEDGLPTNNFNMNSAYKDGNGTMYFGSQDGVVYFDPADIKVNPFQAVPVITGIQLFNKEVLVGDTINKQVVLDKPVPLLDQISLNHKNNILTFSFASMHYASPANNQYAYKLDNLEDDWNYVDAKRRTASYTSLPSGEYLFRLKATNSDGVWSDEASITIVVQPPWWNTNWFRLVILLVLVLLTYALFRLRIRNIKARNITLKNLVAEKTAGLKEQNQKIQEMADLIHEIDQSKLKFFINVSHEFRTPLTLILGPVANLLKSSGLSSSEKEDVRLIERNGYRLLRLTNQLLDSSELDRDTLRLQVAQSDIVDFVREIAHAFEFRADNMDIDYRFESNVKSAMGWFDGDKIEKILYNLISNALKFTNVRGRIRVNMVIRNHQLQLEVIDSGIGIEQDKLDRIFDRFYQVEENDRRRMGTGIGLNLAKKLAEKHKGSLIATSKIGKGTKFVLTVPRGAACSPSSHRRSPSISTAASPSKRACRASSHLTVRCVLRPRRR